MRGTAELTPGEAYAAAREAAEDHLRDRWRRRVEGQVALRSPFWIPDFLLRDRVQRWLADLPIENLAQVVDREDKERQHDFGSSYQTTLWIAEEPRRVAAGEENFRRELKRFQRTTAVRYAGIVGGWAVIGLLVAWFDRLTRGYMGGRLRVLGCGLAVVLPCLAFLL
ncbi:MAG: hypothetical protein U1E73_13340 [Planctomycetota bacterium]